MIISCVQVRKAGPASGLSDEAHDDRPGQKEKAAADMATAHGLRLFLLLAEIVVGAGRRTSARSAIDRRVALAAGRGVALAAARGRVMGPDRGVGLAVEVVAAAD